MATTPDPNKGSEYGGVPGLIQPHPHDEAEDPWGTMLRMKRTNSAGDTSGARVFTPDESDVLPVPTKRLR